VNAASKSPKKAVHAAVVLERAGRRAEALQALAGHDTGAVRARLSHLSQFGGVDRDVARALLAAWDPRRSVQTAQPLVAEIDKPPAPPVFKELPLSPPPTEIVLGHPEPFLLWTSRPSGDPLRLDAVRIAELWGLVGLGSAAQIERQRPLLVESGGTSGPARFAHALGLDRVLSGRPVTGPAEPERTVPLRRVSEPSEIMPAARTLAALITQGQGSSMNRALEYVFIELLRNVVQHSRDPLGGVVGAQVNSQGPHAKRPVFQVAVADSGIGIPESLRRMHRADDPREALERSLWPHISGTFPQGLTGSGENAGLGLFFIAEMAKLAKGRMLIATRDAALMLTETAGVLTERVGPRFLKPDGVGFPGTLVAFEIPIDSIPDFESMKVEINARARERTPQRVVHHWIRFESVERADLVVLVADLAEDTIRAADLVKTAIRPTILRGETVLLDFAGVAICTQSFLHALLYEPVRLAWATRTTMHAVNAVPAVLSGVEFLERYALGG
jgi:anti-sigma regulatory factor (Ser/Thr protein kinase)